MKKQLVVLLALCMLLSLVLSGCQSTTTSSGTPGEVPENGIGSDDLESDFPTIPLESKEIRVMTTNPEFDEKLVELLGQQYGVTAVPVTVSWADIPVRLSTMVMSEDAPDLVINRSDLEDYPNYIVNNLVQPIDGYINLEHKLFRDLKDAYEYSLWGGEHYMLIGHLGHEMGVMFNTRLFEEYDLENPWELYLKGEWDWDALREMAIELTEDEDRDGTPERYGMQFVNPTSFVYSTGKTLGRIDGANKTIVNQIEDPDIARAMNFVSDLITKDKVCTTAVSSAITDFRNGKCAILYGSAYPYIGTELKEMAKAGILGFAPLARDPQLDTHYARGQFAGYFIPVGAKNPLGAVAFYAVERYLNTVGKEEKDNADWAKYQSEYYLSDLNREQIEACFSVEMLPDLTPWLDQGAMWTMIGSGSSWAAQLQSSLPKINARIEELTTPEEYDAPSGPKVIDDFEGYGDEEKTLSRYLLMDGGDQNITVSLDAAHSNGDGKFAAKITYTLDNALWGGVYRTVNKTWNGNNTLRLWVQGDGSGQVLGLRFDTANGGVWSTSIELDSAEGQVIEIPLSEFEDAYGLGADMDLTKVTKFYISFGEMKTATKTMYIDNIEVIAK